MPEENNRVIAVGWDVGGWMGSNHGFAVSKWNKEQGRVEWAAVPASYSIPYDSLFYLDHIFSKMGLEKLNKLEDNKIIVAVDASLGYSKEYINFIQGKNKYFKKPQKEIYNPLAYRETERIIYKKFNKKPLSAPFDRLGNNSTVAISHCRLWKEKYGFKLNPQDISEKNEEGENRIIIEVYPSLLKDEKFCDIEKRMRERIPAEVKRGTDAYDASLCSLMALSKEVEDKQLDIPEPAGPPEGYSKTEEGWIFHIEK
ncbi:MAG: hypothetical protein ACOC21_01265 [Halanaerobiales bacterium]